MWSWPECLSKWTSQDGQTRAAEQHILVLNTWKSWKTWNHTPIQTRILEEVNELKDKEKLNPQESTETRNKFLKRFDWTDTFLIQTEKQAIEDSLFEYHDNFARHRMDIGMNTEFKVKLTPKDDKAVYSQSLLMPIHLKEDPNFELALMHKYGIITILPFSKYANPIFAQEKPNGNYVSLWISGKSTVWLRVTILTTIIQLALCQTQHNTWQGSHCSAN